MKVIKQAKFLGLSIVLIAVVGCSLKGPKTFHANAKEVEGYRVVSFMDQHAGRIGIQIRNKHDEPFYLANVRRIKAVVSTAGRQPQTTWLKAEDLVAGYGKDLATEDDEVDYSSTFANKFEWAKEKHDANIRVWVPLPDGTTHELLLQCVARSRPEKKQI